MLRMEDEGYLSGSQVEKNIESFGIKKPSQNFLNLFFDKSEESVPFISAWYKPKGSLTMSQIKQIIEKGKLPEKANETRKAILAAEKAKGTEKEELTKGKRAQIWEGIVIFVNKELEEVLA